MSSYERINRQVRDMVTYTLSRFELAHVLLSLGGMGEKSPSDILFGAWMRADGNADPERLPPGPLPSIAEKLMRCGVRKGFSLHEISDLGKLLEFSTLSASAMQNWVKRDFKPYFECPGAGKKYSLDQTALLLMIDDLKANLDFDSIRRLFAIMFQSAGLSPLSVFAFYSGMYEELNRQQAWDSLNTELLEKTVREQAAQTANTVPDLTADQREAVRNFLFVAVISVQAAKLQALARRYCQATLYRRNF